MVEGNLNSGTESSSSQNCVFYGHWPFSHEGQGPSFLTSPTLPRHIWVMRLWQSWSPCLWDPVSVVYHVAKLFKVLPSFWDIDKTAGIMRLQTSPARRPCNRTFCCILWKLQLVPAEQALLLNSLDHANWKQEIFRQCCDEMKRLTNLLEIKILSFSYTLPKVAMVLCAMQAQLDFIWMLYFYFLSVLFGKI